MILNLKEIIKAITPPLFVSAAKRLLSRPRTLPEWECVAEGWDYAKSHPEIRGWNVEEVLEVYKEKWPHFVNMVQSSGPLGLSHESNLNVNEDVISQNIIMSFGYALALAAQKKDRLTMLDWGGGIGHYYLLARALLPKLVIDYHCKDVPTLCRHGVKLFPEQHFHEEDGCLDYTYDFVITSTSLHYSNNWQMLLRKLARATVEYMYVANLPMVLNASSFVFVQRPYRYGYNTEYLAWCFNRNEFLSEAELSGLVLVREFIYGHRPYIHHAPEQNTYRGFLFLVQDASKK